jgi:hypothetical protein
MDNALRLALAELHRICRELWSSSESLRAEAAIVRAHNEFVRKKAPSASEKHEPPLLKDRRPDS